MKLLLKIISFAVLGFSLNALADCYDGEVYCNDDPNHERKFTWSCVWKGLFEGCVARDYPSSKDAAAALCADHGGFSTSLLHYSPCSPI